MAVRQQLLFPDQNEAIASDQSTSNSTSLSSTPIAEFATEVEMCLAICLINDFGIVVK